VDRGCVAARFAFGPQAAARASYLLSALAVLIMLVVLAVGVLRRRRRGPQPEPAAPWAAADVPRTVAWRPALALAAAVGLIGGFAFALRAGAVLAVAALVLMRVGVSARRLFGLAAVLIAALPLVYLAFPSSSSPRQAFSYAVEHLGAHWLAVGAVCCLAVGCALDASALRRLLRRG
jgi:hypothetical protein